MTAQDPSTGEATDRTATSLEPSDAPAAGRIDPVEIWGGGSEDPAYGLDVS